MIVLVNKLHGVILAWYAMTRGGLVRMESALSKTGFLSPDE